MPRILVAAALSLLFASAAFGEGVLPEPGPAKPFVYTPKEGDIVIGKDSAPVVIVEYASLSCPHCAHFFNNELPQLTTKYLDTGKAKLVYRHYPLNEPALKAAELVQCADKDRRHAFLKVLFSTQTKWAYDAGFKESLAGIASLGGIDRPRFDACMEDKTIEKSVLDVTKEAENDYKVNSTPTFFVNGKMEKGDHSLASLGKAITDATTSPAKK